MILNTLAISQSYHVNDPGKNNQCPYVPERTCLAKEDYKRLKNSTVLFVIPNSMEEQKIKFQEAVEAVWKISKIVVITADEVESYKNEKNTLYFTFSYSLALNDDKTYTIYDYDYSLILRKEKVKSGQDNSLVIAKIHFVFGCELEGWSWCTFKEKEKILSRIKYLSYEVGEIRDFKPHIVAQYLKSISDQLSKQTTFSIYENNTVLGRLAKDTLFITENLFAAMGLLDGYDEKKKECIIYNRPEEKIMKEYPYAYHVITFDELNEKLANGEKFIYAISSNYANYNLFNSETGNMIKPPFKTNNSQHDKYLLKEFKNLASFIESLQ